VDLFGVEDPGGLSRLVSGVVALAQKRRVVTVSAPMIESHPWIPILHHVGFKVRESSPVTIYTPYNSPSKYSMFESMNWFFMHGDRDS